MKINKNNLKVVLFNIVLCASNLISAPVHKQINHRNSNTSSSHTTNGAQFAANQSINNNSINSKINLNPVVTTNSGMSIIQQPSSQVQQPLNDQIFLQNTVNGILEKKINHLKNKLKNIENNIKNNKTIIDAKSKALFNL